MLRKVLLACGILASLLYVAATILGAMQWNGGYDWTTRQVSELFALDAPSRPLVATAFLAYGVLMIPFGVGVWLSAGHKRALRIVGGLLIGYAAVGLPGPLFFSMHTMVRGGGAQGMAQSDVLHIILTAVLVLLILLSIGFGATAFGTSFRLYSIVTLLIVVVFGALAGLQGGQMAANLPTPWMGVEERLNIFGYMLWVVVLAVGLLRAQGARAPKQVGKPTATPQMTLKPTQQERVPVASPR
ncbi:MAG TPA: DUF998 domain-containing protein [Ktedonobacterales bacterium]|nr:DUF998 domain-containing protein [Ktedonobacterales bacterium]